VVFLRFDITVGNHYLYVRFRRSEKAEFCCAIEAPDDGALKDFMGVEYSKYLLSMCKFNSAVHDVSTRIAPQLIVYTIPPTICQGWFLIAAI
jgi:hypothetical protein